MSHADSPNSSQSILFGTINGVLGVMHSITPDQYLLLSQVESNIIHVIGSIGNFDYSEYVQLSNNELYSFFWVVSNLQTIADGGILEETDE